MQKRRGKKKAKAKRSRKQKKRNKNRRRGGLIENDEHLDEQVNMTEVAQLMDAFDKMSQWQKVSALTGAFDDLTYEEMEDVYAFMEEVDWKNKERRRNKKINNALLLGTDGSSIIRREIFANATF